MSSVLLKKVVITWPNLTEPQGYQGNEDNRKWSVTLLIDKKDKENINKIQSLIKSTIEAKKEWKAAQKAQVLKVAKDTDPYNKYCIMKDGDKINTRREEEDKEIYESYRGHFVVKAGRKESNGRMPMYDAANNMIPAEKAGEFNRGNVCNVQMSAYCYGAKGDNGITTQLEAIQKVTNDMFEIESPFEAIEGSELSSDNENPFEDNE